MGEVAWYLTKEGRAAFGRKCRERDGREKARLNNPAVWIGVEDQRDPTMVEACSNILRSCPGWQDVVEAEAKEKFKPAWRGIDFDHLEEKAGQSPDEAENIDREYRKVIAEAKRILAARERQLLLPALTLAV